MDIEEKKKIGREVAIFIRKSFKDREAFALKARLGKSTVDKLVTGLFSQKTLDQVFTYTGFVRNNDYAGEALGQYSRVEWENYLGDYLFLRPSPRGDETIDAAEVFIKWDENLPGLKLWQKSKPAPLSVGALNIPHRRSPFIYIQEGARMLIVSTMVGERALRGMMMATHRAVANAYVPVAAPVVLKMLEKDQRLRREDLGSIKPAHPRHGEYRNELQKVMDMQYARFLDGRGNS
jgi:hypothetical protein